MKKSTLTSPKCEQRVQVTVGDYEDEVVCHWWLGHRHDHKGQVRVVTPVGGGIFLTLDVEVEWPRRAL